MQKIILFALIKGPYDYSNIFKNQGTFPQGTKCKKINAKQLDPLFDDSQVIFAGYLSVYENSNSALGFIFYGSLKAKLESELQNYPILIWLNGKPGSSSQLGNFMEFGPLIMQDFGKFKKNVYAWNTEYNVTFVDQPIGTGLAYVEKQTVIRFCLQMKGLQINQFTKLMKI